MTYALRHDLIRFFEERRIAGVVGVYLFGSHAENRAHRQSDVDVGVLLDWDHFPSRRQRFELRMKLASELMGACKRDVDVVILNDAPPELAKHVAVEGSCVLNADAEQNHAFVRDAQLRAADIAPFLRRTRRIKLETLRK